ncbi:hypothetical protein FS837_003099 [Tulasnella sp. UAMH 9824]|nr:hypothetical protein FS837_003099 [Tulasnella sp. UAMH 9824]
MTPSGLLARRPSLKEKKLEPLPPSHVRETNWTQLKSKLRRRRGPETTDRTTPLAANASAKENTLAPGRVVYASHYPQVSHDSPFASLSEYEHGSCAPARANAFAIGVVPSADCHARDLDLEENDDEAVEADLSQQLAHVPSSNGFSPLEEPEPSPALAPEPLDPSSVFEGQLAPESLMAASVVQARRWRLRAQVRRARLIAEDLADTSFTLESLDNLSLAVPTETGPVGLDASASGSLSAAAPVSSDSGLDEVSSESVVHSAPSDLEPAGQHFEVPILRGHYDPVLQCFYIPPKISSLGGTGSAENDSRNIDEERIESARVKDSSMTTVAPPPFPRVSNSESSKIVIKVTPPTPPVTMRARYLQRNQSAKEKDIDPDSTYSVLPDPRPSNSRAESNSPDLAPVVDSERSLYDPVLQCFYLPPKISALGVTGSAGNDSRNVDEERIKSARVKDPSVTTVAPPPPTGVSDSESSKVVIKVTPPTPPVTMRAPYIQCSQSVKEGDIKPSSNYTVSTVVTGSCEREIHNLRATAGAARPPKSRPMPTAETFGSSGTLVDGSFDPVEFDVFNTFGYPANNGRIRDGEEGVSAGAKVEPLPFDAPTSPTRVTHRKPRMVKGFAGGLVPHGVRQHARAVKSTITSSLRGWGKAASRLLSARRPSQAEGNRMTSPYFDPWEGYVPPRGPSPELAQPDRSFHPPPPCIANVYVNLD